MALTFATTGDVVDCGSGASLDNFDDSTLIAWVYPTSLSAPAHGIACKETGGGFQKEWTLKTNGTIDGFQQYNTSSGEAQSNTGAGNVLVINTWQCVMFTYISKAPKLYIGTLTAPMVEPAYFNQTAGVGTVTDESAGNFRFGNLSAGNNYFVGAIGPIAYANVGFTQAQGQTWQFNPGGGIAGIQGLWYPGRNGASTVPDSSGNGNTGTITGATVSADPPLPNGAGAYLSRRRMVHE